MKKLFVSYLAIVFAFLPMLGLRIANAADTYADSVVSFAQGLRKDTSAVDPARSDPSMALGVEDGQFVSLGYGGEIIIAFPTFVGGDLTITAFEATNGSYPEERADVYVSPDAINWELVGTADNLTNQPESEPHPTVFDIGSGKCIRYVRMVDTTDDSLHANTSDGFDLDAVMADFSEECSLCPEEEGGCEEGNDVVISGNSAFVGNYVRARADTGDNWVGGSYGGDGGSGGRIVSGGGEIEDSMTGAGGMGGDASVGGTLYTGNATASATVVNIVNTDRTEIDRCACEEEACEEGNTVTVNRSRAKVTSGVEAKAETGDNEVDGSYGGDGGNGGKIYAGGDEGEVEGSSTGMGAAGGFGADGAYIETGEASSQAAVINVVNRNLTRVRR